MSGAFTIDTSTPNLKMHLKYERPLYKIDVIFCTLLARKIRTTIIEVYYFLLCCFFVIFSPSSHPFEIYYFLL
jgi:hypothetical protein